MSEKITAETVAALFREYWRRQHYPDAWWCGHIAIMLQVLSDRRPPPPPGRPDAIMHAQRFLRTAPDMRAEMEREAGMYSYIQIGTDGSETTVVMDEDRHARCHAALAALDEAQRATARAIDAWENRDRLFIKDRDPAKFICELTQQAWASLDGNAPRSVNEDDPLCLFIADALALTNIRVGQGKTQGQPYTAAAISAVLSGRTERLNFIRTAQGDNRHTAAYPS